MIEGDDETEKQAEADDDFDMERPELKIRSSQAALSIVDDLNNFCETLVSPSRCIESCHAMA